MSSTGKVILIITLLGGLGAVAYIMLKPKDTNEPSASTTPASSTPDTEYQNEPDIEDYSNTPDVIESEDKPTTGPSNRKLYLYYEIKIEEYERVGTVLVSNLPVTISDVAPILGNTYRVGYSIKFSTTADRILFNGNIEKDSIAGSVPVGGGAITGVATVGGLFGFSIKNAYRIYAEVRLG